VSARLVGVLFHDRQTRNVFSGVGERVGLTFEHRDVVSDG